MTTNHYVDVVFDGPPGPESGRFVEVENPLGHSISVGEWIEREDGYWVLRIDTTDRLASMLEAQRDLQVESFGLDPVELEGDAAVEFIRWNVLALTDELHEMLGETGWKPWATSRHVNGEAALKELIDALHFWMNLVLTVAGRGTLGDAGVLAETIATAYHEKRRVNAQRQVDGYDGVSTKCPHCRRAIEDAGVIYPPTRMIGRTPAPNQDPPRCGGCNGVLT